MKLYLIIFWIGMLMSCNNTQNIVIGIHFENEIEGAQPKISIGDSIYEIVLDSVGSATISVQKTEKNGYGKISFGTNTIPIYIKDKGFNLWVKVEAGEWEDQVMTKFTGAGADINTYLNDVTVQPAVDFSWNEQSFIDSLKSQLNKFYMHLDSLNLEKEFVQIEKKRLHYMIHEMFIPYVFMHQYVTEKKDFKASSDFYNYLYSQIVEEEALLEMEEYKKVMVSFIEMYSTYTLPEKSPFQLAKAKMEYVNRYIKNPLIATYLMNTFATEYISENGVDYLAEILPMYQSKVTCPVMRTNFEKRCEPWKSLIKGTPSPSFKYKDVNGKEVSLKDLAGKYVYIDIWATWCLPCKAELPALKELEHKYKDRNIYFVSISCDQDIEGWKNMVKQEKLGGIQLNTAGDKDFMKAYHIAAIPRFILLDKEGKILIASMVRPSDSYSSIILDSLEDI